MDPSITTWIMVLVAAGLIILDLFIPSGGLLAGTGTALLIERALDAAGVIAEVRWPLAGAGMLVTIALVVRYGERVSERIFPQKVRTNVNRLVGCSARVKRLTEDGAIIEVEGDLWTAALAPNVEAQVGDIVVITELRDQIPIVAHREV